MLEASHWDISIIPTIIHTSVKEYDKDGILRVHVHPIFAFA